MDAFHTQLRRYRLAAALTQEGLAERAGLSTRGIQNLERAERRPYPDTTQRLVAALQLEGGARAAFEQSASSQPRRAAAPLEHHSHRPAPETNLPTPLTACHGRDADRQAVARALEAARLVTLVGPGGAGKTRLAIEVGHDLLEVGHAPPEVGYQVRHAPPEVAHEVGHALPERSVWLVELDAVSDPTLVAHAVASALGLSPERDQTPAALLQTALREQRVLLILDNCEHVLNACAALAETLLGRCPQLRILATSRQPLVLPGEAIHVVAPLETPPADAPDASLPSYAAVRLFLERAPSVEPRSRALRTVAAICQRLDGMPLALELAAARVRGLGLDDLAARLDAPLALLSTPGRSRPRQQSLRAAIDWSYALLDPQQQALLRRLSVFSGGWTLGACEAVAGPSSPNELASLVDHSLVQVDWRTDGTPRYRLLETVRQYAAEQLAAAGETDTARALHRRYFANLAEDAEIGLDGVRQVCSLALLDAEAANLRAATDSALEQRDVGLAQRLVGALATYWQMRAQAAAGLELAQAALDLAPDGPRRSRAKALRAAGQLAVGVRGGMAEPWLEQSLALSLESGDTAEAVRALVELGRLWIDAPDLDRAVAVLERACRMAEATGNPAGTAAAVAALGQAHLDRAEYAVSLPLLERGLGLFRGLGDRVGEASVLQHVAMARLEAGDVLAAEATLSEARALLRELGDAPGVAWTEHALARVALDAGRLADAAALFEGSLQAFRQLGVGTGIAWTLHNLGRTCVASGDLQRGERYIQEGLDEFVRLDHVRGEGWARTNLAWLALEQGRTSAAWSALARGLRTFRAQGFSTGLSLGAVIGARLVAADWPRLAARWLGLAERLQFAGLYDRARAEQVARIVRERLDEPSYARAWMRGRALDNAQLDAELARMYAIVFTRSRPPCRRARTPETA